ncbi:hypothetical protein PG990_013383 [Apiospora arundinis]
MPLTRPAPGAEAGADAEEDFGSPAKRRKTRKGTRSCWACKRRKEKCVFDQTVPTQDATCLGCQRRGTKCVGQDSPDDMTSLAPDGARQMGDRLVKVENLVQQLLHRVGNDGVPPISPGHHRDSDILTPALTELAASSSVASDTFTLRSSQATSPRDASTQPFWLKKGDQVSNLSQALHEALPTFEDSEMIINASYRSFYMFNKALTVSYESLSRHTGPNWVEIVRPKPHDHPALIARYMLQLAHLLQQLQLKFEDPRYEDLQGLSEPPRGMMDRLSETAIGHVSTQDRLVGSIEGLECIMLESTFYANDGKLRLGWSACRRALHQAQLMGLHQSTKNPHYPFLDPKSKAEPSALWVRIIHRDRSLSLLLGLPSGSADKTVVSEPMISQDTPLGRLERLHCDIMGSLLERRETRSMDLGLSQRLDKELQRAARILPSKWWLTPSFSTPAKNDQNTYWDIKRLIAHMSHYNILNQIHLPYMLRASSDQAYEYSRMTCVNASREILSRFAVLQHFNTIAYCCRTPGFLALMAALTLILAHLQSHHRPDQTNNAMVHQYLSDRGMIEQAQENMDELSRLSGDLLSTKSADLLRRLLAIEAEAADGHKGRAQGVDVEMQNAEDNDEDGVVRVAIPYFGVVRIAREGTVSKEATEQPADPSSARRDGRPTPIETPNADALTGDSLATASFTPLSKPTGQFLDFIAPGQSELHPTDYSVQVDLQGPNGFGWTAGVDDWAFQGIDMAFFDSLLSGDAGDEVFQ